MNDRHCGNEWERYRFIGVDVLLTCVEYPHTTLHLLNCMYVLTLVMGRVVFVRQSIIIVKIIRIVVILIKLYYFVYFTWTISLFQL